MSALSNLGVAILVTLNILRAEKSDGYQGGDQMIINKEKLKEIINESIDELETGASNIATTTKDTLGGAAGSLAKNPMIDKFVQVASERFAKRPLTDKVSFIVRLMELFGVDDATLVRVRNELKKAQQQTKAPQQPQQGAQE